MAKIIWAHGLEGSPEGKKVRALRAAGLAVEAADYNGLDLKARVARLEELTEAAVEGGEPVVLAGSSYGGLAAAIVAKRHPERFAGLLLCAPALGRVEPPVTDPAEHAAPAGLPTIVVHGRADEICPIEESERFAARSGGHVELREVDDGHRLEGSLDAVAAAGRALLEGAGG